MPLLQKSYLGSTPLFRLTSFFESSSSNAINTFPSGVTVRASSTANVKGAWTQLIGSTSQDATYLVVDIGNVSAGNVNTSMLIDFAIGAAGSEVASVENIGIGGAIRNANRYPYVFGLPIKIPQGSRVSARVQSRLGNQTPATLKIFLINKNDFATAPTSLDGLGSSTDTSQATRLTQAPGVWSPIVLSTPRRYRAIVAVPSLADSVYAFTESFGIQVGVGPSGSEQAIGECFTSFGINEEVGMFYPYGSPFPANIPQGSRLSARHSAPAGNSCFGITLVGIP